MGDILIDDKVINEIGQLRWEGRIKADKVIDAQGLYVSSGFIDLQVNGGGGYNFMDASPEEICAIVSFHASHGTAALLPTTVTDSIEKIKKIINKVQKSKQNAILGMHIEGPFVSHIQKGAQNPQYILEPSIEKFNELIKGYEDFIKIVTLAPELPGADKLIVRIKEIRAIPSLGHSNATYEETLKALNEGVTFFTHLFNAMRGFHHRELGAVGAALESDTMVGLIADGIHVHPAAIRLLLGAKGIDKICLVTDSISAAGLKDGRYSLGGLKVFVKDGEASLADGTLAGSTLTMNRAVKNFMEFTGVSLPDAIRTASLNPAKLLGIENKKGSLEEGKDADIVIFDENLNVHYTIIAGEVVYESHHQR